MSQWRTVVRNELQRWVSETGRREVTLAELEEDLQPILSEEFPNNDNIEAGLSRTLQELRDEGEVEFHGEGDYRLLLDEGENIADLFEIAIRDYPEARENDDFGHETAKIIKDEIPEILDQSLSFDHLSIRGSVGAGQLANIPWIGIFDERVTSDPKDGLYIVYLFDTESESVFLTLNQGMTDLQEKYGRSKARKILSTRAELLRSVVDVEGFEGEAIPITSDLFTSRNNLYGTSSICHKEYSVDDIPPSRTWIKDVARLVSEFQRIIDDGHYENLLDAFEKDTGRQTDPFGPIPVDEYDGVEEATADVLDRISDSDGDIQRFRSELSKAIVSDWTEPLKKIAVQTASEISKEERVLIEQIQRVYDQNEEWLSGRAEDLGVGSLFDLDPSQVLYMALLRDIQSDIPEISRLNVNHVKLKTIFNAEYSVKPEEEDEEIQNPLVDYLNDNTDEIAVHTFTAPPDYWLTSVRRRAVSFGEEHRNRWKKVSQGDLALFHSRSKPGNPDLESQQAGFIGAGIVGEGYTVEDEWWWDELHEGKSFPYVLSFGRMFLTSDITSIDQSITISEESDEEIEDQIETLTEGLLPFSTANNRCEEEVGRGIGAQGSFQTFQSEGGELEYERPRIILQELAPLLSESSPVNIHYSVDPNFSTEILDGLYFPDNQGGEIIDEIEAAIRSGKHVILTGPPGTGKTEIAERVAETLADSYPHLYTGSQVTTATADWSTFDTVGGYMPSESQDTNSGESLSFTPGTVLNRLRHTQHDVPINEPLVIDELNRADIDKAFGQLFTVLSGQPVTLPYTRNGDEVEILPVNDLGGSPRQNQYPIPNSWRLLATMNTYDKTSLYEMSYAFMRRFAFIRVGVPDLEGNLDTLMEEYVAAWEDGDGGIEIDLSDRELSAVGQVWEKTNSAVEGRSIGPAIVRDLVLFVENHDDRDLKPRLTRAVIAYVFPQLEGVPKRQEIVENIAELEEVVDSEALKNAASEMLQITFEEE